MKLTRRTVALAAALFGPTLAAGPAGAADPLVIRVGYASIGVDNRPFSEGTSAATARAGNYLEDEFKDDPSVKVEWFFFKGAGPAVNEAFANGQLDFAYQGDLPSIIGRAAGLKTKILLASGARKPLYLATPAGSDIQRIEDLDGRSVALFRGTNNHLAAVKVLAARGLDERDLQIVNMDTASANAALASGDLDAAFGDTGVINLAQQGLARIVYTSKGDDPAFGRNAHVIASEAFETAHPETTARVVKAFVKAAHWSSDEANREALFELWHKSGTPIPILREFFAGETLAYRNSPLLDAFIVDQYRQQAEKAKEYGLIRREVDLNGWFEPRYLEAALKELKLENAWTPYGADGKPARAS